MLQQHMSEPDFKLSKAPIVEAVLDIDCDMPPTFALAALEAPSRAAFGVQYPKYRALFLEQHQIKSVADEPAKHSAMRAIQALLASGTRREIYDRIRPVAERYRSFGIARSIYQRIYGS